MSWLRKLVVAALVVGVWSVVLRAAAPTLGQHLACANSAATCTTALTGLTNGSGLLLAVAQFGTAADTDYTATDGIPNTYTAWSPGIIRSTGGAGDRACKFLLAHNITTTAGALTPVVTRSGSSATYRTLAVEILGMATSSATDVTGSIGESASVTSHPMASPGITTLTDIFMVGVAGASGTNATYAVASGFTSLTGDFAGTETTAQYISSAASRASETATWTNSGAGRVAANCLIALKSAVVA